jgi:MinD superfamily P-loop ATPase
MAEEILIASGKGGAGKTSITASISKLLGDKTIIADYDVDAANLAILTSKQTINEDFFQSGYTAEIDNTYCIKCGKCYEACNFDAIIKEEDTYRIDEYSCEGCGLCSDLCLPKAINLKEKTVGKWYEDISYFNSIIYTARLDPGSDNSGKLVNFLKEKAHKKAEDIGIKYIISDAPPGIGCPVISSMTGIKLLVIVVEMGITGIKDAIRLIKLAKQFNIKSVCIFNKVGISQNLSEIENELKAILERENIEIIEYIPFNKEFVTLLNQKKMPVDSNDKSILKKFYNIYDKIITDNNKNRGEINEDSDSNY